MFLSYIVNVSPDISLGVRKSLRPRRRGYEQWVERGPRADGGGRHRQRGPALARARGRRVARQGGHAR